MTATDATLASTEDVVSPLRAEIRAVIAESSAPLYQLTDAWMRGHDLTFTALLAKHGLIGLTWPTEFGGRAASNADRLLVTEELLRVGAPVAAHWIADRQIGPAILRHGTPELQNEFLPRIAAGELTFCLGMSETESGSDLAAVRTRAVADGDTFRITGSKIWTSHAHRSTHAYVLARTGDPAQKHKSLTEFVVDLSSPGVEVRPIYDLAGEHHFNETIFTDVVVPAGNVIGTVGQGWQQVTEQLAFERGGMERVLSTYPLLAAAFDLPDVDPVGLGELLARLHTLRAIGYRVAKAMDAGQAPVQQAALLKFLGTAFESDVVDYVRDTLAVSPDPGADGVEGLLARGITAVPGATIRGGTTEVLLTIVGRQELSAKSGGAAAGDLQQAVAEVLADTARSEAAELGAAWRTAVELGWTTIGTPESAGGSGGEPADLVVLATELGRLGHSAPVIETAIAARLLAEAGQPVDATSPMTVGLATDVLARTGSPAGDGETSVILSGRAPKVPWARAAGTLLLVVTTDTGEALAAVSATASGLSIEPGTNLAGEPRDTVLLQDVTATLVGDGTAVAAARALTATLQSASLTGALRSAHNLAREHVLVREQFGKPLAAFQAVAHNVARIAAELASAEAATAEALVELETGGQGWRIVAARIVAARAALAVAKLSHQLLGAMGITREHDLHLATLRLWSWRDEGISSRALSRRLGSTALAEGQDAFWNWNVHEADLDRSAWGQH